MNTIQSTGGEAHWAMRIEPTLISKPESEIPPGELFMAFMNEKPVFSMKTIGPEDGDPGFLVIGKDLPHGKNRPFISGMLYAPYFASSTEIFISPTLNLTRYSITAPNDKSACLAIHSGIAYLRVNGSPIPERELDNYVNLSDGQVVSRLPKGVLYTSEWYLCIRRKDNSAHTILAFDQEFLWRD